MYTTTGFLSGLLSKWLLGISNDILLETLNVHYYWISEWFTIKTVVRNVYGHLLKHSNGNSSVCNDLALSDLNLYTPNGNLIKPNKLKSKGILSQLKRTSNMHLKTELNWERKLAVNDIDWKNVWENVYSSKASLKAKQFQWKYMHNVIFTEHRLMLMKVSNGKCNICGKNKETLNTCSGNVKPFIGSLLPEHIFVLNYKYMVLGSLNKRYKTLINTIIVEAKIYIWLFRNYRKFENYDDFKGKLAYSDLVYG